MANNQFDGLDDAAADVLHSQASQIRNNVLSTQNQNPDQAAQYQHLAKFVGIPVESVYSDPDAVKAQASMQQLDTDKLTTQYPHLAQFMTDHNNVAKAHDDFQTLGAVEHAVKSLDWQNASPQNAQSSNWSGLFTPDKNAYQPEPQGALVRNLQGATFLPQDLASGVADLANKSIQGAAIAGGTIPMAYDKIASLMTGNKTTDAQDWYFKNAVDPLEQAKQLYQLPADAPSIRKVAQGLGGIVAMLATAPIGGEATAAEGATDLATSFSDSAVNAARVTVIPAITNAIQSGKDVYNQTGDMQQAMKAMLSSYGTTTAMGMAPVSLEGGLLKRVVSGFPLGIATGEMNRQFMNDSLPGNMQQPANIEDMLISGLTGSILGGAMGHSPINDHLMAEYEKSLKADQSVKTMEALQAVSDLSSQSKLRERDPQAFNQLIKNMTDESNISEVYVDANKLSDVMRQAGVTPEGLAEKLPDVASQMKEALEVQGDVRIPVADYATHIAGGELDQALMPHLKVDPEGMTYAEGQEHQQQQSAEMQRQAIELMGPQTEHDQREQQLNAIQDDIKSQLESAGRFPSHVNDAYSALHRAWYDSNSQNLGLTPDEMYQQHPLNITADNNSGFSQESRGSFNPENNTIGLHKDADLSTFLHESGHFYLSAMHDMVSRDGAPERMKNDFDTLLKYFGVEGNTPEERLSNWSSKDVDGQRAGHEQFAESFEKYLLDGKAPTQELQSMFGRFRSWLLNVYRNLSGRIGQELDPEVKGVMDRMLASEDAIKEAERVRAYAEIHFADESDPEIENYKNLSQEATQGAVDEMQAKSVANMKWLSNAKSKAMKSIQREAREQRKAITEQVTKEVADTPIEKAKAILKEQDISLAKTNYDDLRLDLIAEQHGFISGKDMAEKIKAEPTATQKIKELTDQRMLEKHGDLIDPVSIERAAEAAIHNEARAKMMATGLKILTKSPTPVSEINRAAKLAADTAVAAKKVGELRPKQYAAQEAKANRELLKLAPKDPAGAAQAQRSALLNNRLFKSASEAVNDVQKGLVFMKRFSKESTRKRIDVDIRDQIDELMSRFDLRANPTDAPTRKEMNLEAWVESQKAAGMNPSIHPDLFNQRFNTPYREMTVEQFRGLVDTIKSMEHIGKERNQISVEGKKVELDQFVNEELVPKMKEYGDRFTADELYNRPEDRGNGPIKIAFDHFTSWLRSFGAQLKPQEFKRNFYDLHEIAGPFGKAIFERVMAANYHKVDMLKGLSDDFRAMAENLGKDWQDSMHDMLTNDKLIDAIATQEAGEPVFMRLSRGKMIGIATNVGNESNFYKLTKGYGWEPEQVWRFLNDNMTAKDWQAVQHVWDLYEKHWPEMSDMYRRLGQTIPDKVEARSFNTKFGEMRGGYAAIKYDALRSKRGEKEAAGKAINPADGLFGSDYFSRATTTNGSMNARNEGYTDTIDLNFHTIERSLHESIHDLAYREALIDVNKIIEHDGFRKQFMKSYGREDYKALQDWLGRTANSENSDRDVGAFGRILQYTRTGLVQTAIALRATTVLKHGGSAGIKTLGYFTGGGEKYLASRMAAMGNDYTNQITGAQDKFPEIRARLLQQDRDYRATASSMFEPESARSKAERFGHSAVAWADMMTAVPTAWAAYDRAVTEGIPVRQGGTGKPMSESDAVAYASKIVREAHGSNIESARSNIMTAPSEAVKMFTTLYGFMNNSYGQTTDSISKFRTKGIGNPEVLARTFMAIIVPALWAEYLTDGLPDEKDIKGWSLWAAKAIIGEQASSVVYVRDAYSMAKGLNGAGVIGAESWLSTMVHAGKDTYKLATDQPVKAPIRDISDAVGMGLHIPGLGQIGKSAQYMYDVHTGAQPEPETNAEYIKNIAIGPSKHH